MFTTTSAPQSQDDVESLRIQRQAMKAVSYTHLDVYKRQRDDTSDCICTQCSQDHTYNLKCHHVFHLDCLERWYSRRNTCPVCKQPIDFIVTIEDHYTFNRDVYEQSLREANARSFAVQALELSVLSAVC